MLALVQELEDTVEMRNEEQAQTAPEEPAALAVSMDEFSALEERVRRAVELVKRERLARAEAEERAGSAEATLRAQMPVMEQQQSEMHALRAERDQVRKRVELMLAELDALEL
jgi:flagellar biosynthesis/type III secretory pathway protein FliH